MSAGATFENRLRFNIADSGIDGDMGMLPELPLFFDLDLNRGGLRFDDWFISVVETLEFEDEAPSQSQEPDPTGLEALGMLEDWTTFPLILVPAPLLGLGECSRVSFASNAASLTWGDNVGEVFAVSSEFRESTDPEPEAEVEEDAERDIVGKSGGLVVVLDDATAGAEFAGGTGVFTFASTLAGVVLAPKPNERERCAVGVVA
jgi:hypothetical protein